MAKQTGLQLKRDVAREEILAIKENILTTRILDFFGRAFKSQSLGYWLSNIVIMNLLMLGPWELLGRAMGEFDKTRDLWVSGVIIMEMVIIGIMVGYAVMQDLFRTVVLVVIEKIDNEKDLSALVNWFRSSWSLRNMVAYILTIAVLWFYFGYIKLGTVEENFYGVGIMLSIAFLSLFAGLGFYIPFWVALLAYNLGNYEYQVDSFFTADSEIVRNISEKLNEKLYVLTVYFAFFTLFGSSRFMNEAIRDVASIPFLLIVWAVITAQFILIRSTFGRIVNRAKMKTLDIIRLKIDSIQEKDNIAETTTAERVLHLMDIYERVKSVKVGVFDLKSFSTFVSQLILPLLGLLLGSLDKVLALFP